MRRRARRRARESARGARAYRSCQQAEELSREARQRASRFFSYRYNHDGSLVFHGQLPTEIGALLVQAIEAAVEPLPPSDVPAGTFEPPAELRARRADALGQIAESFLAHGAGELVGGDRYQVVVHVAAETLRERTPGRCEIEHGPSLAAETAQRLGCDASVVAIVEGTSGEPLDVGRKDIAQLEERLGVVLPPSYKAFLSTSNGWRRTTPFIGRIRPAAEVDWFRIENEDWIEAHAQNESDLGDAAYYDYERSSEDFRAAHLQHLVQISDVDDGVYVLNPQAVTPDGEWEAWFFATWKMGDRGFDVLVEASNHSDARVRHAAAVGLDVCGDPRARQHLDRLLTDSDETVRERARMRLGKRPGSI